MPVGNIDPQNDTYTRASMKLGDEEYPSSIQQALCKNTGYLMYAPRLCHQSYSGTVIAQCGLGSSSAVLGYTYFDGGVYDFELRMTADGQFSGVSPDLNVWIKMGTVNISSEYNINDGTTIVDTFSGATIANGWHALTCFAAAPSPGVMKVYQLQLYSRQYKEA